MLCALLLAACVPLPSPIQAGASVDTPALSPSLDAASPRARALWESLLHSTYGADSTREHVGAFSFDVGFLRRGAAGSNEEKMTLRFLEPGSVHLRMRSGREQGRGTSPNGIVRYWYRENAKAQAVPLKGRDYKTDVEELDRLVALCGNFLTLANPREIETLGLDEARPPKGVPRERKTESRQLSWISFESQNFHLPGSADGATYEVLLGIDEELAVVKRAQVSEIVRWRDGEPRPIAPPIFLSFDDHAMVSGVLIPRTVFVYDAIERTRDGFQFADKAGVEVYVLDGRLSPPLKATDFLP